MTHRYDHRDFVAAIAVTPWMAFALPSLGGSMALNHAPLAEGTAVSLKDYRASGRLYFYPKDSLAAARSSTQLQRDQPRYQQKVPSCLRQCANADSHKQFCTKEG